MKKILLHICCGICAGGVIERLREENFKVIGFFYNPNIHPEAEYKRRLEVAHQVSKILDFELIEWYYNRDVWFKLTENLKDEPEGGKRCEVCFRIRLDETCKKSTELDIPYFTTTLSVSPHKNVSIINKIGKDLSNENFLEYDFKKREGFKKAIDFSNKYNLYRQNYCGCVYSMRD
jgi:predicted adenine nucleotide alpha hydrolase (AANH) superfamily ATPase